MAISYFDNPAQLPPIDFGFLAQQKAYNDQKDLTNLKLYADIADKLPLKGGYATQKLAQDYNNNILVPLTQKYTNRIAKNESPATWYRDYVNDVARIKTDPVYNKIKEDEAYAPTVAKQVSSPQHKYAAQYYDYYDPKSGFSQISAQDIQAGWNPEEWYKAEAPVTYFDDFKNEFAAVKSKISQIYGAPVESLVRDENGNVIASIRTQEGTRTEVLNRDMIKDQFRPMFTGQNYETLLGDKASLRYNTLKSEKNARAAGLDMIADSGLAYTNEQALDDVANHFMGSLNTVTELAPKTSQTKLTGKSSGPGVGIGETDVNGLPNEVAMTLNKLGNLDAEGNISGKTKTRAEVLVPMIGGHKEGNNFVVPFDSENPAFLQVPKTITGSNKEEFSLAKALPYKTSYENYKKQLVEDMYSISKDQVRSIKGIDSQGNPIGFSYLDDGTIGVKDAQAMQNPMSGWSSKITLDQFINQYLPNTELVNNPNNLALASLATQARDKFGIDLSDPNIQAKINKVASTEQGKLYQEVAQTLASLQGNHEFYTDNSSDNLFLDDNGTPIAKGFVVLNSQEIKQLLPNYKKAVEKGIIAPFGFTEVVDEDGKKQTVEKYKIPVYRGTDADVDNTTQSYVDAAYSSRKDIDNLRTAFMASSRSAYDNLAIKKGYQVFSNKFNNQIASKVVDPLKDELMTASIELGKIDNASATQANKEIFDLYDRYANNKISKANLKKELYLMYLGIQALIAQQGDPTAQVPELEILRKTKESFR